MSFDPNAAAEHETFFGLPLDQGDPAVGLIVVPYEGTVSYRAGTAHGPDAIRAASVQVDLLDQHFGSVWQAGITEDCRIEAPAAADTDEAGGSIRERVRSAASRILSAGAVPGVIGGEHAVSLGAIEACTAAVPSLGVVQIDAHMDLRSAYEGHRYSHASVMRNALEACPTLSRLVQIGVRDYCEEEIEAARASDGRVSVVFDADIWDTADRGGSVRAMLSDVVDHLPEHVYISVDVDGLDPSLCPNTGTPVPGGLSFNQACTLLQVISQSGRRVIGFDLVEVSPGEQKDGIDANVGARLLYKLAGCAVASRPGA